MTYSSRRPNLQMARDPRKRRRRSILDLSALFKPRPRRTRPEPVESARPQRRETTHAPTGSIPARPRPQSHPVALRTGGARWLDKIPSLRQFDTLTLSLMGAFAVFLVITVVLAVSVIAKYSRSGEGIAMPILGADATLTIPSFSGPEYNRILQPDNGPDPIPWDGTSRVSVLVMGLDYNDTVERSVPHTDSMMLLSYDPASNTAGMLSIPRDLWVPIPNFGEGKINTAYFYGEGNNLDGGGPGLAIQTVQDLLGIQINYYAVIDFNSFVAFIDELGGLDMYIHEEIIVDPIGPNNTVHLYPGVQNLNGATVLAYARARNTDGGDFDRARRQQEVLLALRDQVLTFNMLPTLVSKAPKLYNQLASGITTNLTLGKMIEIAIGATQVPPGNIKQGVIGLEQAYADFSYDGQYILVPIYDEIRALRDQVFSTEGAVAATTPLPVSVDSVAQISSEQARIWVQNGTNTSGLAGRTSEYLTSLGLNIVGDGNADGVYDRTTIIVLNEKPATQDYLVNLMTIAGENITWREMPGMDADLVLILGEDWAAGNPMP